MIVWLIMFFIANKRAQNKSAMLEMEITDEYKAKVSSFRKKINPWILVNAGFYLLNAFISNPVWSVLGVISAISCDIYLYANFNLLIDMCALDMIKRKSMKTKSSIQKDIDDNSNE